MWVGLIRFTETPGTEANVVLERIHFLFLTAYYLGCWRSPAFGLGQELELSLRLSRVSSLLTADPGTNWSPCSSKLILYNEYITFICYHAVGSVVLEGL